MHGWRLLAFCAAFTWGLGQAAGLETIHSALLKRDVKIALHVPSAVVADRWKAAHPGSHLRLVLFLPGAYDGPEDFSRYGIAGFLADQEAKGMLPPSLWVAVEHFKSWYANRTDGTFPYERFLLEELVPRLEAEHPGFGGSPSTRSVAGLSMGGFGALNLAARSGAFSTCLALSPALIEPPFQQVGWFLRHSLKRTFPLDPARFVPWNPWKHLGGACDLVVTCGTEDKYGLAETCRTFARICQERGRPLYLQLSPGGHDWAYWTPAFKRWTPWLLGLAEAPGTGPVDVTGISPMIGP